MPYTGSVTSSLLLDGGPQEIPLQPPVRTSATCTRLRSIELPALRSSLTYHRVLPVSQTEISERIGTLSHDLRCDAINCTRAVVGPVCGARRGGSSCGSRCVVTVPTAPRLTGSRRSPPCRRRVWCEHRQKGSGRVVGASPRGGGYRSGRVPLGTGCRWRVAEQPDMHPRSGAAGLDRRPRVERGHPRCHPSRSARSHGACPQPLPHLGGDVG